MRSWLLSKARRYGHTPGFWKWFFLGRLLRRPFWFRDKFGVSLNVYPEDDVWLLFEHGVHFDDKGVLSLLSRMIQKGMTVFDVGANHGQFAVYVAPLVGDHGHVHSFEPTAYSGRRLTENVSHSKSLQRIVRINRLAMGERCGEATMYNFPPAYSAWNSLGSCEMESPDGMMCPSSQETVTVTTVDDYCSRNNIDLIDLLKIDVEGFEKEVLLGTVEMIQAGKVNRILFEVSLEPLSGMNRDPWETLDLIRGWGFQVGMVDDEGHVIDVHRETFSFPPFANYLATREPPV